jgi:hypothetical protein
MKTRTCHMSSLRAAVEFGVFFAAMLVAADYVIAASAATTRLNDDLEAVITQNEGARRRVSTCEYVVTIRFAADPPADVGQFGPAPISTSDTVAVARTGDWIATRKTGQATYPGNVVKTTGARSVVNGQCAGFWWTGTRNAQQYDHTAPAAMSREARSLLNSIQDRDLLVFGFGNGLVDLRALVSTKPERNIWSVARRTSQDQRLNYELRMEREGELVSRYVIDPESGFLVTRVEIFQNGAVSRQCDVTVGNVPQTDIFYPRAVKEQWFEGSHVKQSLEMDVTDFNAKTALDDQRFEIAALGLPEGTYLIQHPLSGPLKSSIIRNSQTVPMDAELKLRLAGAKDPFVADKAPDARSSTAGAAPGAVGMSSNTVGPSATSVTRPIVVIFAAFCAIGVVIVGWLMSRRRAGQRRP